MQQRFGNFLGKAKEVAAAGGARAQEYVQVRPLSPRRLEQDTSHELQGKETEDISARRCD